MIELGKAQEEMEMNNRRKTQTPKSIKIGGAEAGGSLIPLVNADSLHVGPDLGRASIRQLR